MPSHKNLNSNFHILYLKSFKILKKNSYHMNIRFLTNLKCFNCNTKRLPELETTGRIILPNSILSKIAYLEYDQDIMLFQIRNETNKTEVCAGVLTFTMPEGEVCTPAWMMESLGCNDNDDVVVSFVTLPVATKIVLQPYSKNFDLNRGLNIGVILEYYLCSYPCLTEGTVISIKFNYRIFRFKILKTEPTNCVKIHKSDVECDIVPSIYNYSHCWNEQDSDSSDDDDIPLPIEKIGHTLRGRIVKSIEIPKPKHSTFIQRENERIHNPKIVQKKNIDDEILPPKPQPKKTNVFFSGKGRTLASKPNTRIHYYYLEFEKCKTNNMPYIVSALNNKKLIEKARNSTNPNPYQKPNIVQNKFFQGKGRFIHERKELNQLVLLNINPICVIVGKRIDSI